MYDAIVIGAGLAGSGLAAGLAGRGWRVLLVERDTLPRHKVCGEFLSPESQGSLAALGLHEAVAALRPATMQQARFVSRRGRSLSMPLPGAAWGLSRYVLDAALAEGAARLGAEVATGTAATGMERSEQGWSVVLRDACGERQAQGRAVVVACGRNPLPGLRPEHEATRARQTYVGLKCHYDGLAMPPQVEIYLFDGGYAGLGRIEGGRANLCLLVTREAFRQAGGTVAGMLATAIARNRLLAERMRGAVPVPASSCAVAPVDTERVAVPWDGVARLGDAATMIPPLCGDGMAMALRSAELCLPLADRFLAGAIDAAGWERSYEAAWHAEFDGRLRTGRRLQRLLSRPLLGDALLAAGAVLPAVAERLVHATRGRLAPLEGSV